MIITITGKPCSGKGTVSKILCDKYNFEYICTGDMFRTLAYSYGYDNILEFQKDERIKDVDNMIDSKIKQIGIDRINDDIIIDSRLAWNFIPNSFKVFIDVDWNIAGERLLNAKRDSEQVLNLETAIKKAKDRWDIENNRYIELYNTDNTNPNNYNLVISSNNASPEELAELIYTEYKKFMLKA